MHRTRIVLGLALTWGADIAGTWLLPDNVQIVVNGAALAISFAMLSRWIERKAQARAQVAIIAANEREQSLIRVIERLSGAPQTGPMAAVRRVA